MIKTFFKEWITSLFKVRKGVLVSQDASGGGNLVVEKCAVTDAGTYTARGN